MSTHQRETHVEPEILHLSNIVKRPLVDATGDRIGRVQDLVARLGDAPHPPIVGLVVTIGARDLFVPIRKVAAFEPGRVLFDGPRVDLRRFERREGELLLARDLLARHAINFVGGRIIKANEIELAKVGGTWEVVAVDPSSRPLLRRLLGPFGRGTSSGPMVDWASIEPFVAHVPTSKLRIPYRKLSKLRPAQIADLVEAASHEEGEEIIEAVGQDHELEADVFEELDAEHQAEFVRNRSDAEAARLLASMAPDDAADLIGDIDQERRLPILDLLPEPQQGKVRALLSYHPETAGGLMSPDFLCLPAGHPGGRGPRRGAHQPVRTRGAQRGVRRRCRRRGDRLRLGGAARPGRPGRAVRQRVRIRTPSTSTSTGTSGRSSGRCRTSTSSWPRCSTRTTTRSWAWSRSTTCWSCCCPPASGATSVARRWRTDVVRRLRLPGPPIVVGYPPSPTA